MTAGHRRSFLEARAVDRQLRKAGMRCDEMEIDRVVAEMDWGESRFDLRRSGETAQDVLGGLAGSRAREASGRSEAHR